MDKARFNLVVPMRKGAAGTRGVPDGSGPEGKGPTGRQLGGCPKREDFESDSEYEKALKEWKAANPTEKSIVMLPTELLKGGKPPSRLQGTGNAKGTVAPRDPEGSRGAEKPKGAPKAESSKRGGDPRRLTGRKPNIPPYFEKNIQVSGSQSSAAGNYLKMESANDGKTYFLHLKTKHTAKFDHKGNITRVVIDGKKYPVQNHLVKIPSGIYRIAGMVSVANLVAGANA